MEGASETERPSLLSERSSRAKSGGSRSATFMVTAQDPSTFARGDKIDSTLRRFLYLIDAFLDLLNGRMEFLKYLVFFL